MAVVYSKNKKSNQNIKTKKEKEKLGLRRGKVINLVEKAERV